MLEGRCDQLQNRRGSLTDKVDKPKDYYNSLIKEIKLKETALSLKEESNQEMPILSHWLYIVMLSKEEGQ